MKTAEKRCQQHELYRAEERVSRGKEFTNIEGVRAFVRHLRDQAWWDTRYFMVMDVEVNEAPRGAAGSVGGYDPGTGVGQIDMNRNHFSVLFVLHELAHVVARALHKSQAHCPWFALEYLRMVYSVMGSDAYVELKRVFDEGGIEVA
jgi:putative metallohydrolase (TIGR04338 family)